MSDPLAVALARLAPTVDVAASRELLDRSLDGAVGATPPPSHRRRLLAAACVVLLVAGAVGVWAVSGRDEADAPAAPTTVSTGRGNGTEFRVIATEPVGDFDVRSIRAAGTDDDLVSIVSRFGPDLAPFAADVDLTSEVALVIERPDNACPAEIDRFEPADDTWTVVWRKPGGACEDVGLGWVYLVAIDRSALAGVTEFVLPAEQQGSLTWEELRVANPALVLAVDPDYAIVDATWDCAPEDSRQFTITLDLPPNANVTIDVVDDDVVGGSARVQVGSDGLVSSTGFGVTGIEPSEAEAVVSDVSTGREVARMSLAHLPIPTCG